MAAPAYAPIDPNLPPEVAVEQQRIARQQEIARAMLQQGMAPLPQQRTPYHWSQGLASVIEARLGKQGLDKANTASLALGQKYQQGMADEVKRIAAMKQGRQAVYDPQEIEQSADQGNALPSHVGGDPRAAVMAALTSQYPVVRKMGELDYSHMKKADEPYTLSPDQVRYGADGAVVATGMPKTAPEKSFKVGDTRKVINGETEIIQEYQADGSWKEIGKGPRFAKSVAPQVNFPQPVTPVTIQDPKDPNSTIVIDGRTKAVLGKGPKLSETGKANQKRQIAMQGVSDTIQQARALLEGKGGERPTQSGIGTAVDYAASIFGMTPDGAKAADKLRVAGGALVQKVPRFEGPQSDKDVSYYKEVAGRIGDSTLPVDRRLAALDEVENIWGQFEAGKKHGYFAPAGPEAQPSNAHPPAAAGGLTPAEQAELDALRKKHGRSPR